MKNQSGSSSGSESPLKSMGDRFAGVVRDLGLEAWEELKTGIDKAWDEIKIGVDEGLEAASGGVSKGWMELSRSIDRAKDSLFMTRDSSSEESEGTSEKIKPGKKREKEKLN